MASIAETYQLTQAVSASPLLRLLTVYDCAVSACRRRHLESLTRALCVLTGNLDLRHEQAHGLLAIYQWCGEQARNGQFEEAKQILTELRDTWAEAGRRTAVSEQPAHPHGEWQTVSTTA